MLDLAKMASKLTLTGNAALDADRKPLAAPVQKADILERFSLDLDDVGMRTGRDHRPACRSP
jgi:hypothetical protein